jgi:hypothetical protein
MYFLPQRCEFFEVQSRHVQNLLYGGPLGICGADHIFPLREGWMAAQLGKTGAQARSIAKAEAVRANGKLGGNPRKAVAS